MYHFRFLGSLAGGQLEQDRGDPRHRQRPAIESQLRTACARGGALIAGALLWLAAPTADAASGFKQNPILFVHGIEGTGAQFESQKMRFMSNGYPESWIDEVDY